MWGYLWQPPDLVGSEPALCQPRGIFQLQWQLGEGNLIVTEVSQLYSYYFCGCKIKLFSIWLPLCLLVPCKKTGGSNRLFRWNSAASNVMWANGLSKLTGPSGSSEELRAFEDSESILAHVARILKAQVLLLPAAFLWPWAWQKWIQPGFVLPPKAGSVCSPLLQHLSCMHPGCAVVGELKAHGIHLLKKLCCLPECSLASGAGIKTLC